MAMIKCSECRKEISNMASACPNCGAPNRIRPVRVSEGSPVVKVLKVIFGLAALVLVVCGVTVNSGFFGLLLFDLLAFGLVGLLGNC